MYTYKLPITNEEVASLNSSVSPLSTGAVADSKKTKDDLLKQLADIDKQFKNDPLLFDISMPENLGLSKMGYDALSDEQIQNLAKSQTDAALDDEKTKLQNEYNKLTQDLLNQKEGVKQSADEIAKNIDDVYSQRKSEAEKDALKRGLARSSIITGKIETFDANRINDKVKLESEAVNSISKIDQNITSLENEKNLALENFNISLAAELLNKINELKVDRANKINETLKYNNDIAEKEAKYQKDKETTLFDMEKARKNDVSNEKLLDYLYSEKAKIVKDFYDNFAPAEALRQLGEDSSLKEQLGGYYNYLVQYFKSKM